MDYRRARSPWPPENCNHLQGTVLGRASPTAVGVPAPRAWIHLQCCACLRFIKDTLCTAEHPANGNGAPDGVCDALHHLLHAGMESLCPNREGNLRPGSSPGEQMAEATIYIAHKRKEEEGLKNEERDGSTEEGSRARLTLTTNLMAPLPSATPSQATTTACPRQVLPSTSAVLLIPPG